MSDQPLSSAVNNAVALQRLREHGIHSVFNVVREGRPAFVSRLAGSAGEAEAKQLYDLAERRASGLVRLHTSLVSRDEPTARALPKLASGGSRERLEGLALGEGGDFETWFGRTGLYPGPDSVASLFSPASYLVDLYRVAKKLHLPASYYHIDVRRRDLAGLVLSQGLMDKEIPTLELVNDILVKGIERTRAGAGVADEIINTAVYPFGLPYDVCADEISLGLNTLAHDEEELCRQLINWDKHGLVRPHALLPPEVVRARLDLSPGEYKLLSDNIGTTDTTSCWGGLVPTDARQLVEQSGLGLPDIHHALATDRASLDGGISFSEPSVYGASYINQGQAVAGASLKIVVTTTDADDFGTLENYERLETFEYLHRLIRLKSHTTLSFEELDWLWNQGGEKGPSLRTCMHLVSRYEVARGRFNLSLDAFATIYGTINRHAHAGETSFLTRVFREGFQAFINTDVDFGTSASPEPESAPTWLAQGLGIDQRTLRKLALLASEREDAPTVIITVSYPFISALYRLVEIPRIAGLNVDEGIALWSIMFGDIGSHIGKLALPPGPELIQAVDQTLASTIHASDWLREHNIDMPTLATFVATEHRLLATEEIIQFVRNIQSTTSGGMSNRLVGQMEDVGREDQLSRHVASQFGLSVGTARAMIRWLDKVIGFMDADLASLDYSSAKFWLEINGPGKTSALPRLEAADVSGPITQYCHLLGQFALVCHMTGLQEQDIALIVAPVDGMSRLYDSSHSGTYPVPSLTLETIFWLYTYAEWRDALPGSTAEARSHFGKSKIDDLMHGIGDLAKLNGWDPELATQLWADLGYETLEGMHQLHEWASRVNVATRLRLSPSNIGQLIDLLNTTDMSATGELRRALAPAILGTAHIDAESKVSGLVDTLAEHRRDALLLYYLRAVVPLPLRPIIKTADDLYEYMLLDAQVSARVKTSRIAEAISSLQLYLHRCREGLEPDVLEDALASEMRPGGYFAFWDAYNKRYGTWTGLQRLLRYPASYLDPSLRYAKTTTFRDLEDALSQGRLTGKRAEEAFLAYAEAACQMLEVDSINSYVELTDSRKTVYFLGKSRESPARHLWRTWQASSSSASAFSEWHPIDADIPEYVVAGEAPSIAVFAGSLRVVWWTWKTTGAKATFTGADGGEAIVESDVELYANIATLGAQNSWRTLNSKLWHNESTDLSQTYIAPYPEKDGTTRLLFLASDSPTWDPSIAARSFDGALNALDGPDVSFTMKVSESTDRTTSQFTRQALLRREEGGSSSLYEPYLPTEEQKPMFISQYDFHPPGYKYFHPETEVRYDISSMAAPLFRERLHEGVDTLLSIETQRIKVEPSGLDSEFEPIRWHGGPSIYLWELFLHAPFLIACRLIDEQRFDEAEPWLRRIFSPSGYVDAEGNLETDEQGNVRYWNVAPLLDDTAWGPITSVGTDDPDEVAMTDPMHYKLAVYLRWMQLYMDRGDMAYRQQTRDTLTEAKMCYVQATQLLGRRPYFHDVLAGYWKDPTLSQAAAETAPSLDALEALIGDNEPPLPATHPGQVRLVDGLFLAPVDDGALIWWDRFAQRLYNLRHGLSLDGRPLSLPLYETPVSPRELQRRRLSADGSNGGGLDPAVIPMPAQRFSLLLDRAHAAVQQLMQFGTTLQGILDRRDADALTVLQQTQQVNIQAMAREIHAFQIKTLEYSAEGLQVSRTQALDRKTHFSALITKNLNTEETESMGLRTSAPPKLKDSGKAAITASALDAVPNTWIAGMAAGTGGIRFGSVARAVAEGLANEAYVQEMKAGTLDMMAGFARRLEEWQLQADQAALEVTQLDAQINANTAAIGQAMKQATQIEVEQGYAQAVLDMLTTRFSGKDLFNWQSARLSSLYYQFYDATFSLCTWAQKAYQFDTAETTAFLQPGAWDDRYQGLLAGESLALSLQRMECAHLAWDQRMMEVERTLSLGALAAQPLGTLIGEALGSASGTIPSGKLTVDYDAEVLTLSFKMSDSGIAADYPSGMQLGTLRRVKSIAVTLPAVLGAYEDVRAVLSYTDGVAASLPGGCTAVALSRGVTDHGVFNLDLNDSKYLPFEGIPVDDEGTLSLRFPNASERPQEDMLRSLNDVILHVRYTMLKV